jgi:Helix-turn-helix domain
MSEPLTTDCLAVTIPEAQRLAGVSRSMIYRLLREGHLAGRKIRGRTVIETASIRALLSDSPAWQPQPNGRAA